MDISREHCRDSCANPEIYMTDPRPANPIRKAPHNRSHLTCKRRRAKPTPVPLEEHSIYLHPLQRPSHPATSEAAAGLEDKSKSTQPRLSILRLVRKHRNRANSVYRVRPYASRQLTLLGITINTASLRCSLQRHRQSRKPRARRDLFTRHTISPLGTHKLACRRLRLASLERLATGHARDMSRNAC